MQQKITLSNPAEMQNQMSASTLISGTINSSIKEELESDIAMKRESSDSAW